MNISIIEGCIGCTLCASTCPEVFRMGGDGLAEVYTPPSADAQMSARAAAECCPVSVIKISE